MKRALRGIEHGNTRTKPGAGRKSERGMTLIETVIACGDFSDSRGGAAVPIRAGRSIKVPA